VMSVVVSSTVLLYATIADVRDRAAAQRREEIAQEYQQVLEKRVEAEHILNERILELAAQISLQGMQVARLEKIRSKDRKQGQDLARAYEEVLEKRVQAQEQVLEKRVQEEHELNEKILAHAVENSVQMVIVENLEKLRSDDREHAAGLARAYEQVLEQRVQAQERVLEKRVQEEHELNEKILAHAVENSIQNILVENLEKLRAEDREHAAGIARAYEKVLEQRVQEEHELNEKILQSTIENVLGERLKMVRVEEDTHAQEMHQEVMMSFQTYRAQLAELAQQVQILMPGSSGQPANGKS
jgi:spore germination protein YaaH